MAASQQQSKTDLRAAAREKAAALRAEQLKKEARVRRITLLAIIVGILLVGALIAVIVMNGNSRSGVDPQAAGPTTATGPNGGIPFDAAGVAGQSNEDAVTVEVYADFICPACGSFEQTYQSTLDELREAGDITVVLHPLSMLSRGQKAHYSSRSTSAFGYVAQYAPDKALAFNTILFENQPSESSGLTDDQIVELAKQAGVPDDIAEASVGGEFVDWSLNNYTNAASNENLVDEQGRFSTPTVVINGVKWDGKSDLRTAIEEAVNGDAPAADDASDDAADETAEDAAAE